MVVESARLMLIVYVSSVVIGGLYADMTELNRNATDRRRTFSNALDRDMKKAPKSRHPGIGRVFPVCMALGLMLSPENLVLVGRMAGNTMHFGLALLAIGAVVHLIHGGRYRVLAGRFSGPAGEALFIESVFGIYPAMILPVLPRVLVAVCIATAVLVSSGFIFNEVILFWFPNFAFAGILLGVVLAVNLLGQGVAEKAQAVFAGTVLCGLIVLIGAGLLETGKAPAPLLPDRFDFSQIFIPLLIFIGYDMAYLNTGNQITAGNGLYRSMAGAVIAACILFGFWGAVSILHVPSARLAGTTIPHILAAKAILGQTGRIIMAVIVIGGSCAAVNALFSGVSRVIAEMARNRLMPKFLGRARVIQIILALSAALMMVAGVAGSEKLDLYLRAGLLLWLLCYAAVDLSAMVAVRETGGSFLLNGSAFVLTVSGVGFLVWRDPAPGFLAMFLASSVGVAWLAGFLWLRLRGENG